MRSTHLSLLGEACDGSQGAWTRMIELYQPWVLAWLERHGVRHHDAEELAQEVMAVVARELNDFDHSGRNGAFRHWLREITVHRAKGFWRSGRIRPAAGGGSAYLESLEQLADPASELSRRWDREHDQHVLRELFARLDGEFELSTMQIFRLLVFDERTAEEVAAELGISVGATYSAKSRVLRRLRQEAQGLVDDSLLA